VISLQAAAARRLAESDPAASVGALATLRSTIDLALEELGSGLPGARLTDLVREARAIGLTVDLVGAVPTGPLASVLERVVQEALTNAMRHAPGAAVHIELREDAGRLRCTVRNGPATAIGGAYPSAGQGLRGIAHRVGTAGGTLDWRPTHDGGFRVDVVLPTIQETVP
jgi:signal transduction histidine kinase